MLTNPVFLPVIIMVGLCLAKLYVLLSLIIAAFAGGLLAGMPLGGTMGTLVDGMGGNASTALSYILLGALAATLYKTGIAVILTRKIRAVVKDGTIVLLLVVMDRLRIDRRGVAAERPCSSEPPPPSGMPAHRRPTAPSGRLCCRRETHS